MIHKIYLPQDLWPKKGGWEGRVVDIYVSPGDRVSKGDILVDVEIEKAILSIESDVDGVVKEIYVDRGSEVSPGSILLEVEYEGEDKG